MTSSIMRTYACYTAPSRPMHMLPPHLAAPLLAMPHPPARSPFMSWRWKIFSSIVPLVSSRHTEQGSCWPSRQMRDLPMCHA